MISAHPRSRALPLRSRLAAVQSGPASEPNIGLAADRGKVVICVLLALTTIVVYSPVVWHPFINYDDPNYVTENQHVRSGVSLHTIVWATTAMEQGNWHPLTWIAHALDWQLYGTRAGGHHLSSLLLHVINVVMLFLLLARATGLTVRSSLVAALFALHPLNVESVAWIAERKNVLSMFFFLLALAAYGWYARKPTVNRYVVVGVLFIFGLASKPMIITLPFVLLLLDYWPLGRIRGWTEPSPVLAVPQTTWLRLLTEKLPLFGLCVGSAIITVIAQQSGHAVIPFAELPFQARAANAIYSYAMYIVKVMWPVKLAILYPHPLNTLTFTQVALSALCLIMVSVLVWRERINRPYMLIGWLWFLGTLIPVIGLIQVGAQAMADRYAYLPAIGIFLLLVWRILEWAEARRIRFSIIAAVAGTVLFVLCALTIRQLTYWRSSYDLWAHTLQVTRDNFIANEKMADFLVQQNRPEALDYYEAAANIVPLDPAIHGKRASVLQDHGDFQGAIREYNIVLRSSPDPTIQAYTYASLGVIYRQIGDYAKARENSEQALRLDSDAVHNTILQISQAVTTSPDAPGYLQLGLLLEGAGQMAEARAAYTQALRLDPDFGPARKALGALGENKQ
jgi:Tfp pilus assembly protein PilF